ncbi:hypothetical protein pEaSNUABM54_00174 [Erwinia phage pEa_SNUABM_54]|nr:hypothetical protein pEaSNUABM54_00174 [Erwinia phage pEa_SNUABM_54]
MFKPALLTPSQQLAHANLPWPFLEEGEQYRLPEPTQRQMIVSATIARTRDDFESIREQLIPKMAVKCTPKDISDVINCGFCHVFARIVSNRVAGAGIELKYTGDPFHVWLYDTLDDINYDSFYAMGTYYRDELDGGYGLGRVVDWDLDRVRVEYPLHDELYAEVSALIKGK